MLTLTNEQFNYVYDRWTNRKPFAVEVKNGPVFNGVPFVGMFDNIAYDSPFKIMFEVERSYGTITYVFYANGTPIAWEGSFGLQRVPTDSYVIPFNDVWADLQSLITNLTAENVDADTASAH